MTATFFPVAGAQGGWGTSPALSVAYRFRARMFTASSTMRRRHRASQGCSQM